MLRYAPNKVESRYSLTYPLVLAGRLLRTHAGSVFTTCTSIDIFSSTPGRIRTCDLLIRSQLLYPAELRGRAIAGVAIIPALEKDVKLVEKVRGI